jgi:mRNA-degrading endonuclease toxin of MazEF toxin-antitoxin module
MGPPDPRQGEIWNVFTPGQPDDPHQPRPAIVVSENTRNRRSDDVIVVPLFSSRRLGPTRVLVAERLGGIDHESVAFCEEITTVQHRFLVNGPLGPPIPETVLDRIIRAVRRSLGEIVLEPAHLE